MIAERIGIGINDNRYYLDTGREMIPAVLPFSSFVFPFLTPISYRSTEFTGSYRSRLRMETAQIPIRKALQRYARPRLRGDKFRTMPDSAFAIFQVNTVKHLPLNENLKVARENEQLPG